MGEMISIGETSFCSFKGIGKGRSIKPKELSVPAKILDQSKDRHAHRRNRAPSQKPLNVFNCLDALDRHEEQQPIGYQQHKVPARLFRSEGDRGPAAQGCGVRLCGIPQGQDVRLAARAFRARFEAKGWLAVPQGLRRRRSAPGPKWAARPDAAGSLADGPSQARNHGQRGQHQLSQGMTPAHYKGKKEDDRRQGAVDNVEQ